MTLDCERIEGKVRFKKKLETHLILKSILKKGDSNADQQNYKTTFKR